MATIAKKVLGKQESIKHPFTRKKLAVLDSWDAKLTIECPECHESDQAFAIAVVQSDVKTISEYHVFQCSLCKAQGWSVLT